MFWQILIHLAALQVTHVVSYCDGQNSKTCATVYSKLENLCYDYTGKASDYFSVQDIHQRDGFFAIREASLYVAYNACGKITRSIDNYRTGQDLEKNKVSRDGSNPAQTGGSTPTPSSSSPPSSTTASPSSSPSNTTPSPSSSSPSSTSPLPSTSNPPSSPSTSTPSPTPSPQTPPPNSPP